jgi:hypothetical protein
MLGRIIRVCLTLAWCNAHRHVQAAMETHVTLRQHLNLVLRGRNDGVGLPTHGSGGFGDFNE